MVQDCSHICNAGLAAKVIGKQTGEVTAGEVPAHLPTSTGAIAPKSSLARLAAALVAVPLSAAGSCDGLAQRTLHAAGIEAGLATAGWSCEQW